jgi:hypothetical protein
MPMFQKEMGIINTANRLLRGHYITEYKVPTPVAAWIKAVTQTDEERALPKVVGSLSKEEFQQMF